MHQCTEFGATGSKCRNPTGSFAKKIPSLARAPCTSRLRQPQNHASLHSENRPAEFRCWRESIGFTCNFFPLIFARVHAAGRFMSWVVLIIMQSAPSFFRRSGASNGASLVPVGPAVRAPLPIVLGHTDISTPSNFVFITIHCRSKDKSLIHCSGAFIIRGRHCFIDCIAVTFVDMHITIAENNGVMCLITC